MLSVASFLCYPLPFGLVLSVAWLFSAYAIRCFLCYPFSFRPPDVADYYVYYVHQYSVQYTASLRINAVKVNCEAVNFALMTWVGKITSPVIRKTYIITVKLWIQYNRYNLNEHVLTIHNNFRYPKQPNIIHYISSHRQPRWYLICQKGQVLHHPVQHVNVL